MPNPLDPQGLIAPLHQSTALNDAAYNQLFKNAIAPTARPADMTAAQLYPAAPQLNFQTNATGIGTGIMQGLGNAVNNYQMLKNYRTKTEMLNNAVLQQQQREQQQMDMLRLAEQANQTRRTKGRDLLKPEEQGFYDALSGDEQDKILVKRATGKADAAMAPDQGAAEGQKKIAEHDALVHAFKQYGPLETSNAQGEMVPNPVAVRAYSELLGKSPYLTLDANKDYISAQQANVNLKSDQNELGAQPGDLKRKALSETLANSKSQVELKYADALKVADMLTAENRTEEANKLKKDLADGQVRYKQALAKYETLTPGQIKLINSQFESFKLPYKLPEKKEPTLHALTHKGNVTGFTDSEGHVYDANRKLKH